MQVIYKITVTEVEVEEEQKSSYGIKCLENNIVSECIEDISIDRDFITEQVELFNKLNLSPRHFHDAVEDLLE